MLTVAESRPNERALFIQRTYMHLAGAVAAFTVLEVLLFVTGIANAIAIFFLSSSFAWLGILAGFSLLGWLARSLAEQESVETQYIGLGIYVVAEAIIFVPLLYIALSLSDPSLLPSAVVMTLSLFGGLTAIVFTTKKDFSFLEGTLKIVGFAAFGLILCSIIFGFNLGIWFSAAMIVFAAAAILYDTSRVMNDYRPDQYVAASLQLFASVAVLLWYVIRILIQLSSRR
jgi:uncharacterized protein